MSVFDKVVKEVAEATQKALREAAMPLFELAKEVEASDDRNYASTFCRTICNNQFDLGTDLTKELVEGVALKHNIYVSVGEYGNGQFLILNGEEEYYPGYEVGDWVSSSETC